MIITNVKVLSRNEIMDIISKGSDFKLPYNMDDTDEFDDFDELESDDDEDE